MKKYLLIDISGAEPKGLYSDEKLECVLAFVEGIIYPKNLGDIIIDTDIFMDEIKIIRVRNYYGENYREVAHPWTIGNIINNNLWESFYQFLKDMNVDKTVQAKIHKLCEHIQYKISLNKNFYCLINLKKFDNFILIN